MADNPTIKATLGIDSKGMSDGADDARRKAEQLASTLKALFGREPIPEHRAARALAGIARGIVQSKDAASGFDTVMTSLAGNLKLGVQAAIPFTVLATVLGAAARAGAQSKREVGDLERETHKLVRTADFSSAAEGLESLTEKYSGLRKENRKLTDEISQFSETRHPVGAAIKHLGEQLFGRESLFGGPSESERKLTEAQGKATEKMAELRVKMAGAARDELQVARASATQDGIAAQVLEERAKTQVRVNELRKREVSEEAIGQIQEASNLRLRSLDAQEKAAIREEGTRQRAAQIGTQEAGIQLRIAGIGASALTNDQKSLAISREQVGLAKEQALAAQNELDAAQAEVVASQTLSREEKARAAERLERAQGGVLQAQAGVVGAAAGVGEAAGAEFEKGGAEEELSPREKEAQYRQRLKKFYGLRQYAARTNTNPDLIEAPRWGEPEYDALAKYRAAKAREAMGTSIQQTTAAVQQAQLGAGQGISAVAVSGPDEALARYKAGQAGSAEAWLEKIYNVLSACCPHAPQGGQQGGQQGVRQGAQGGAGGGGLFSGSGAVVGSLLGTMFGLGPILGAVMGGFGLGGARGGRRQPTPPAGAQAPAPPIQPGMLPPPAPTVAATPAATPAAAPDADAIRADTYAAQGIDPTQSMANVSQQKLAEIQANKDATDAYWARPDVQAGMAAQDQYGKEELQHGFRSDFATSSARDKLPQDESGLAHQMSSAPWRFESPFGMRPPSETHFNEPYPGEGIMLPSGGLFQGGQQQKPMPSPHPTPGFSFFNPRTGGRVDISARPDGGGGGSGKPLSKDEMDEIMSKYWNN